jgi:DNA-binding MarR family transcriptional regulator
MELDEIIDLFFDNIKHLFFPENWLQLDLKFSKSEIFSLLLIEKRHDITMTELADYINSPMSTSNGIIERLVKKGYVVRDRSESDRRIVVLRLTGEGEKLITGFKELVSGYLKMALETISEEEVKVLADIILKVVRAMQQKLGSGETPETREIRKIAIE